jgi:hypothetical protein
MVSDVSNFRANLAQKFGRFGEQFPSRNRSVKDGKQKEQKEQKEPKEWFRKRR